jgi:hypothetical protein
MHRRGKPEMQVRFDRFDILTSLAGAAFIALLAWLIS